MNIDTNPRAAKAIGAEVLRVMSSLDIEAQFVVLRWAHAALRRKRNPKGQANNTSFKPHAVTLGLHDATIVQGRADGMTLKAIAAQIGCSTTCVQGRVHALRSTEQ